MPPYSFLLQVCVVFPTYNTLRALRKMQLSQTKQNVNTYTHTCFTSDTARADANGARAAGSGGNTREEKEAEAEEMCRLRCPYIVKVHETRGDRRVIQLLYELCENDGAQAAVATVPRTLMHKRVAPLQARDGTPSFIRFRGSGRGSGSAFPEQGPSLAQSRPAAARRPE